MLDQLIFSISEYAVLIADSKESPNEVTPKTRPPLDKIFPSDFFVPAWKTLVLLEILSNPVISSFVGYEPGYPSDAKTTHTAN